jgi:hypothetical protein
LRVLAPRGRVVIMDSPMYRDHSSGLAMVREREEAFERPYGFRPPLRARASDLRPAHQAGTRARRPLGSLRALLRCALVAQAVGGSRPREARTSRVRADRRSPDGRVVIARGCSHPRSPPPTARPTARAHRR